MADSAGLTPFLSDPDFTLYVGDVRAVLPQLAAESADCAMTSPPFFALRDYRVEGQIGLEADPAAWIDELVSVFREVRRMLSPIGTLWVECGDSYAGGGGNIGMSNIGRSGISRGGRDHAAQRDVPDGVKPKDLLGTPWLLAFALRADGWWLRQCIVWAKPNAMPESATDRCTTAHSYIFLFAKSARYWFDAEAIAETAEWARWGDQTVPKYEGTDTASGWMQPKSKAELRSGRVGRYQERAMYGMGDGTTPRKVLPEPPRQEHALFNPGNRRTNGKARTDEMRGFDNRLDRADGMKNPRSVWTIPTRGFPEAHFATWPEALCERIIKAGCPEGGTILDPFMGSGTTALVARRLGRKSIGVELNEEYAAMCARRLQQLSLLAEAPA